MSDSPSLRTLFHPRSVAVVGASRDPDAVGHRILAALVANRFAGPVYPVNPEADHVASIRAYPSVAAIGEPVELAVIAVPAPAVVGVIDDCAEAGVRGAVVISAGFAESGEEGRRRQDALRARIEHHGMRMVGPNCLGLLDTDPAVRLDASFAPAMPPPGTVALCSQSGALGIAIIDRARRIGLGLSAFVSIGNKADVSSNDLLEYWERDPGVEVVLLYLESFGDPRRFARVARRVSRGTPVVAVKSGRSEAGGRAASSHTAALTTSDSTVSALLRQAGVIRAESIEEMFDVARLLTAQPLPPGGRVAVVTNAGGPGILCVDALQAAGLRVEPLDDRTQQRLRGLLPDEASTANPIDMVASAGADHYRRVIEAVLCADGVDALVAIHTPVGLARTEEVGRAVAEAARASRDGGGDGKPVLATVVGGEEIRYAFEAGGETIPVFSFPEEVGRVLGRVEAYARWRREDPGTFPAPGGTSGARAICRAALDERGPGWLSAAEARGALAAAGLDVGPGEVAHDEDRAAAVADEIGYPVAVKLASLEIVHKTELGGVVLGVEDEDGVRVAFRRIRDRLQREDRPDAMEGVLVQPMVGDATEVMLGVQQDPLFGPVMAFGLGGVHVEILRDVAFRTTPLSDRDAREMIREIRGFRLLEGYRGHPAADLDALERALLRLAQLVDDVREIHELDLNPVFAMPPGHGYRIADARIRVGAPEAEREPGAGGGPDR